DDGEAGLAAVAAAPPDLIILDLMMPGLDGYEVCRRLKSDDATRAIPIVIVTALNERADKIRCLELGADDFLSKPVDRVELLARVRSLIRQQRLYAELVAREREVSRLKDEFVSVVSHELRTPLSGVLGLTGLLLATELTPRQREYAEAMQQAGDALLVLINDLLDFAKIGAGKLELERLVPEVGAGVPTVAGPLGRSGQGHGATPRARAAPAGPPRARRAARPP